MKALELVNLIAVAGASAGESDPITGPEVVFDDHGSFRSLTEVVARDGKIVIVLEPHA